MGILKTCCEKNGMCMFILAHPLFVESNRIRNTVDRISDKTGEEGKMEKGVCVWGGGGEEKRREGGGVGGDYETILNQPFFFTAPDPSPPHHPLSPFSSPLFFPPTAHSHTSTHTKGTQ